MVASQTVLALPRVTSELGLESKQAAKLEAVSDMLCGALRTARRGLRELEREVIAGYRTETISADTLEGWRSDVMKIGTMAEVISEIPVPVDPEKNHVEPLVRLGIHTLAQALGQVSLRCNEIDSRIAKLQPGEGKSDALSNLITKIGFTVSATREVIPGCFGEVGSKPANQYAVD